MQTKNIFQRIFLFVAIVGAAGLLVVIFFVPSISSPIKTDLDLLVENATVLFAPEEVKYGLPIRLIIPTVNVDSSIEYVGVASDGTMEVTNSPINVAWFKFGPRPGENGSSVIAGHYGWKNGISAVFDNLHEIQKGDKLYIEDDNGVTVTFVVREVRSYDPKADASNVFGSSDGKAHLNLVTCDGPWNRTLKSRPSRIVVFTDKE